MTSFYLDSADRSLVEPLLKTGLLAGITTNPTLLHASGVRNDDIPHLVRWAVEAGARTVFVQAWGDDAAELEQRGRELRAIDARVEVKLPVTAPGLAAAARLEADGIPVLVTAVYSAMQVLPAIAVGASRIAPYLGRMNDAGRDGFGEIAAMQRIIDANHSSMRILVASLRSPVDAQRLAELGVPEFTLSPGVWHQFFRDPLTENAVDVFNQASSAGS
jgi:transaldolase